MGCQRSTKTDSEVLRTDSISNLLASTIGEKLNFTQSCLDILEGGGRRRKGMEEGQERQESDILQNTVWRTWSLYNLSGIAKWYLMKPGSSLPQSLGEGPCL